MSQSRAVSYGLAQFISTPIVSNASPGAAVEVGLIIRRVRDTISTYTATPNSPLRTVRLSMGEGRPHEREEIDREGEDLK